MTIKLEQVTIAAVDLSSPTASLLITRLNAELTAQYPDPDHRHFELAPAQVAHDSGVFLVAQHGDVPIGCGALRRLDSTTGELKRMYVIPEARGYGVARRILAALEQRAGVLSLRRLVLETGELQIEAIGLYESVGFIRIPCFGEYLASPISICLGKELGKQ